MTRRDNVPSLGIITAPPGGSRRPKSAGVFPSANRKLVTAIVTTSSSSTRPSLNQSSSQPRRPQPGRYSRPPSAIGPGSPRPRPCLAAMQLWRQPGAPVANFHNSIVQRVVREEIGEQRHVTLDAQRQLHELQATIIRRREELNLAHRHLHAHDVPVNTFNVDAIPTSKQKTDIAASLRAEIAHQDAYKKRLRYMHNRLMHQVQYLEANADLLSERRRAVHRERTLCRNRVKMESDKNRLIKQQLRELHGEQAAFKRNALPVLESYRDELASRLVVTQRRQDADRRREELLRFIGSRPSGGTKVSTRSLSIVTAAITLDRPSISRVQRRDSYNILVADADENKRETLFAVYDGQYARVLRETGEVDLNLVLERFQSYRESTARLKEIEAELRSEGARLIREQQAHGAMVSSLRLSGPADVGERRPRLRDRLEGAVHAQQLERAQARDRLDVQLKAFVYVQQGVLHIVELLQCLEDRPGMALSPPASVLTIARTVMGGSQPAELALKTVAPALQTLVHLARDMGRRGLQRDWFKLPALGYSEPQVVRLEQFAPEDQVHRGSFGIEDDSSARPETNTSSVKDSKQTSECREDDFDATVMRRAIKMQEKETLRQAEVILHQAAEAKKLQLLQIQQQKGASVQQLQQQSDTEIVSAHFREQRRTERQENRYLNRNASPFGHLRSTTGNFSPVSIIPPVQSPRRRHPPK